MSTQIQVPFFGLVFQDEAVAQYPFKQGLPKLRTFKISLERSPLSFPTTGKLIVVDINPSSHPARTAEKFT